MCYLVYYTFSAFTNFLLEATTGLLHGVLSEILLSFTLIFHLWSIMIGGNREKFKLLHYFSIFALMCVDSLPTKIMFVDTKYKNEKQIL